MCQVVDLCFYNLGQASPLFRHHEGKLQTRYRNRHCLGRRAVNQNTAWKQINAVIVKAVEFGSLHTYMLYVRPARVSRKNDGARCIYNCFSASFVYHRLRRTIWQAYDGGRDMCVPRHVEDITLGNFLLEILSHSNCIGGSERRHETAPGTSTELSFVCLSHRHVLVILRRRLRGCTIFDTWPAAYRQHQRSGSTAA